MDIININELYSMNNGNFYHYTSADALLSIIQNSTLRFTHCSYLNDIDEYNYIFELLKEILQENENTFDKSIITLVEPKAEGLFLVPTGNHRSKVDTGEYFVLSGSNQSDSISMWNYYCKSNNYYGYSININIEKIIRTLYCLDGQILFGNIIYDKNKQKQILYDKLLDLETKFKKECEVFGGDEPAIMNYQQDYYDFIQSIRLFIKRPGFAHEEETRLVLLINKNNPDFKLKFSTVNGVIKPIVEYKFNHGVPIDSIIMSPSIEKDIGEMGLRTILSNFNYPLIPIMKSELRLRY